jgi:hypothetical protein
MLMETARQGTQESLAKQISNLTPDERAVVVEAMQLLAKVFSPTLTDTPPEEGSK